MIEGELYSSLFKKKRNEDKNIKKITDKVIEKNKENIRTCRPNTPIVEKGSIIQYLVLLFK